MTSSSDNKGRWAVMPVKSFDMAKSRLEGVLTLPERRELAQSLMRNALTALVDSGCFEHVVVVSRDEAVLTFGAELGAEAIREEGPPDLNEALRSVRDVALVDGAVSLLVLFSDLPHVTAEDIRALVEASRRCSVVIGPDRRAEGTNALLLRPPDAIDYAFGALSFEKHLAAASKAGLEVVVLRRAGIGLDVDFPEDLAAMDVPAKVPSP
jgi:2-phospho-L-lactate/phosphoenolpyruvate guanylyltransferase